MSLVRSVLPALAGIEITFMILVTRTAHLGWPPMRIAGISLLLLVVVWVGVARYQLGRSFSVTPQARQLVTSGLYARIRNPIYLASPVLLVSLSLVLREW